MQDDGIAVSVMENLRKQLTEMGLELIFAETDVGGCYHGLAEGERVIVADAAFFGEAPGSVRVYPLEEMANKVIAMNAQHEMGFFHYMRLYKKGIHGYFIGIEIAEVGFGNALSEKLKQKFEEICVEVARKICELVKEGEDA